MDNRNPSQYEAKAQVLKALAHPTRLCIVDELGGKGERCVRELTDMIGSDMSTVSRHISILKNAGLLDVERRGSNLYYSLRVACALDFLDCVEAVLSGKPSQLAKNGPACSCKDEPE